jgi:predicted NAD-dependent protein-ADP-ribosyltransferase YbiA (DUF1768 family)
VAELSSAAVAQLAVLEGIAATDPMLADVAFALAPINAWSRSTDAVGREITNFAHTRFELDGRRYESMEGFFNGLLYLDNARRAEIAHLWGLEARAAGRGSNLKVTRYQNESIELGSAAHHRLLFRALTAKFEQNSDLGRRFVDTHPRPIIHDTGHPDHGSFWPHHVFAAELMRVRHILRHAIGS